jgi:cytosine/adenosine deaminase-related metal-dependent hydrolase
MPDTPQILADRLLQEAGRVVDYFNHLNPSQWGIFIYPEQGTWSFHQLLAHFVSSEIGRRELIGNVSKDGKGAHVSFDIDLYNQREVERLSVISNNELLDRFTIERKQLAAMVAALTPHDLTKVSNDPFLGLAPISEMVKLTDRHNQIHLREIRRYL